MLNIIIIFPSRGSNRGPLTFQAVLLGLLNYPLYVGIIYLRLQQKISLHTGTVIS